MRIPNDKAGSACNEHRWWVGLCVCVHVGGCVHGCVCICMRVGVWDGCVDVQAPSWLSVECRVQGA